MAEGQLVIVLGEEKILVSCPSSTPYVEATKESLETSFQALEIMNNVYVEAPPVQPHLSGASLMVARVMLRDGYEPGMGLGKNGDGTTSLMKFIENRGRFSLGYKPTHVDKRRVALERKERSLAHLQG